MKLLPQLSVVVWTWMWKLGNHWKSQSRRKGSRKEDGSRVTREFQWARWEMVRLQKSHGEKKGTEEKVLWFLRIISNHPFLHPHQSPSLWTTWPTRAIADCWEASPGELGKARKGAYFFSAVKVSESFGTRNTNNDYLRFWRLKFLGQNANLLITMLTLQCQVRGYLIYLA